MQHKKLIASIYIKDGEAVDGLRAQNRIADVEALVKRYNDSGIDKLLIFDLSEDEQEHEKNILAIKELNRLVEVPVCAGGNISRTEDIKKLLYAGCQQVMLNSTKPVTARLAEEAGARFGREKIAITLQNVDILFKHREAIEAHVSEMIVLNQDIVDTVDNVSSLPYVVKQDQYDLDRWVSLLRREQVSGIFGSYLNDPDTDVMKEKMILAMNGIKTQKFESAVAFDRFQLNSDGLIPVIVQDYRTLEVLMLAYMNREAFSRTIESGKMTYFSRSRQELWLKGETSGHYQYVKSLTLDCDNDTILAKVSQVGVACHTGAPSCFFQDLVQKDTVEKNPLKVFESVYSVIADRKVNPKKGSYTNYLLEKGLDKILKKIGEEATELVIAAKNPDPEELKYEISDLLYHMMVLMLEKGVTWEDISRELAQR
ncbi:MAG: bifunctional phosphoribosyl-AMP cyclohydrolase/phosphoribosyl-ATP diphosphatase HisIE [Lachnospiraceae bacterium]|nr:bifunctional phosphoribosyl-AMP cyclohydrolase/phosphoribosyl-ATP diphosphatase HisIE [Lachnospiraceae bacterium]